MSPGWKARPGAPGGLVARSRALLETVVVISIDLRYDDRDVAETRLAVERVLPL